MDIVVIGGGLSGLTAAALLRAAGADVRLLEASARIGGRIHAVRDPGTGRVLADLGPSWVWPKYQPVVARWIEALGLETHQQFNDGDAVVNGYGPAPLRQPLPGQDGMVRIAGGPTALVDALSGRLGAASIRTSARVVRIDEKGPESVGLHLVSGEVLSVRRAIVAIPLRVAAAEVQMPWVPRAIIDIMRSTPTWMSTHAKAVALYERPFWRDMGLSGRIVSRTGPLAEAHDHCGADGTPAAIFGFAAWPPEVRRQDPKAFERAVLDQLAACFGPAAAHPADLVVQDWAVTPGIVSDLDLAGPAAHPDVGPAILRQAHLEGRIRFAVSETSRVSPGLIEGALAAGEHAARSLLEQANT